jgi:hypothetical protein
MMARNTQQRRTRKGAHEERRGQAALEYLVTYGWGFVVIIVVIGGLAYFGFLNPSKYIPEHCSFGEQLSCTDYQVGLSGTTDMIILIEFQNNFGADISVTEVAIMDEGAKINSLDQPSIVGPNVVTERGTKDTFRIRQTRTAANLNPTEGERIAIPIQVTFKRAGANTPSHTVNGEIFTTVQ